MEDQRFKCVECGHKTNGSSTKMNHCGLELYRVDLQSCPTHATDSAFGALFNTNITLYYYSQVALPFTRNQKNKTKPNKVIISNIWVGKRAAEETKTQKMHFP